MSYNAGNTGRGWGTAFDSKRYGHAATVRDLIAVLSTMPQDLPVRINIPVCYHSEQSGLEIVTHTRDSQWRDVSDDVRAALGTLKDTLEWEEGITIVGDAGDVRLMTDKDTKEPTHVEIRWDSYFC